MGLYILGQEFKELMRRDKCTFLINNVGYPLTYYRYNCYIKYFLDEKQGDRVSVVEDGKSSLLNGNNIYFSIPN